MSDATAIASGVIGEMRGALGERAGDPVRYRLTIGDAQLDIDRYLGNWLRLEWTGRIVCASCGAESSKRFGDGYCYRCFSTLARCDLCVVSPDRCHFERGTCREPEWGLEFCMRPHLVYLANSAGAKVGITHPGNLPGRWLDQGAAAALPIVSTETRHAAGCVEKVIGRHLRESTDWRALVSAPAQDVDLPELWRQLAHLTRHEFDGLHAQFALDVRTDAEVMRFTYPVARYSPALQLKLDDKAVGGRLDGVIGSYLLFDRGVFNVRAHGSYDVRLSETPPQPPPSNDQMELF